VPALEVQPELEELALEEEAEEEALPAESASLSATLVLL
jgi:hypothetical protein|tara:strand:- start:1059 stop:1175 length:117 start_codon:yes stop_codon:yes gene_type:complete